MSARTAGLAPGILMLAAACAGGGMNPQLESGPPPPLSVEVQNQNFNAITVYAYRGGFRDRLGYVEAATTHTFEFKWPMNNDVRFLIDFLAQGCIMSEPLPVFEGDELLLIVRTVDDQEANPDTCYPQG
jgi:hypothetical protein